MMGLTEDVPVTIVIKAPNQRMADQTVECQLTWTIKKLKQHLESVYPSKPKHNEQRLIYSGRLLQDHLTLKDILRQYDSMENLTRHTVHLVCPTQHDQKASTQNQQTCANPPTPSSQAQSTPGFQTDGLRHRATTSNTNPVSSSESPPPSEPSSGYDGMSGEMFPAPAQSWDYSPEQYTAMMQQQQQLYSQYMMQYMQYYQSAFYPYQSFNPQAMAYFPQAFIPTGLAPQPNIAQAQVPPAVGPDGGNNLPRAGPARQNVRMNAQGGMEEDEEEDGEPRDWLHHTYFFMRFLTFMGILFFYSNLTRFLAVFSGSCAIYFLQKLRKYMQRRERERQRQMAEQAQANNQETVQEGPHQEQQGQEERPPAPTPPLAAAQPPQPAADQQPQQPPQDQHQEAAEVPEEGRMARLLMFACNTVQTFFTSLVPAPPELLEAN